MKLKLIISLLVCLASVGASYAQAGFGREELIINGWKFILSDVENGQEVQFNDNPSPLARVCDPCLALQKQTFGQSKAVREELKESSNNSRL